MIIDCISDLHGHYPELEGGDLLIVAGDLVGHSNEQEYLDLYNWIRAQNYRKKIVIAGNHDTLIQRNGEEWMGFEDAGFDYLCDSGTEFVYWPPLTLDDEGMIRERKTFKIWGSPWTKRFPGMNPKCMAFTVDTDEELAEKWKLIPPDTDILVTHCPPRGIFDQVLEYDSQVREMIPNSVGSSSLNHWIKNKWQRLNGKTMKIHIFGHIHEHGGKTAIEYMVVFGNASHVNERYEPVNKPIRIEL